MRPPAQSYTYTFNAVWRAGDCRPLLCSIVGKIVSANELVAFTLRNSKGIVFGKTAANRLSSSSSSLAPFPHPESWRLGLSKSPLERTLAAQNQPATTLVYGTRFRTLRFSRGQFRSTGNPKIWCSVYPWKKIARFSGKINCINCSRRCNLRVATRKSTISQGPKKLKHVDVRSEKVDSDGGTCLSFCGRVNTCFFSEWRKNIFRLSRKQKCSTAGISLGSVGRTVQNKLRIPGYPTDFF